ncbi:hypothetical protein K491DRAFT_718687 [Lophiostoma macrostomum CBS 122681]|uniref:Uncharacterized protein n=1 Tax=Lophiostoma macrostomum CBS 122681 TaxID=1314788 RepID=A0A6A6SYE7_9PLEO|nr:hypothetical protein K491DRAFT_718687 [Lophiostoma macrostomum CBS 122681]
MSTVTTAPSTSYTILDRTKWPACALSCRILTTAEADCLPPVNPVGDQNSHVDCFCRNSGPFNAYEYHKLCKEECGGDGDGNGDGKRGEGEDDDGDENDDLKKVTSCWEEFCNGYLYQATKGLAWTSKSGWQSVLYGTAGRSANSTAATTKSGTAGLVTASPGSIDAHPSPTLTAPLSSPTLTDAPDSTPSPNLQESRSSGSTGAIAGIAVGSAVVACVLIGLLIWARGKRKAQLAEEEKFELGGREHWRSSLATKVNTAELGTGR